MTDTLYDTDFVTWTERQAAALREAARAGSNLPLDWENLAEEVEDLGKATRNKVRSLAYQIQVHLLKLACSGNPDPRAHWMNQVDEFRSQLARELEDNHALRSRFAELSAAEAERAFRTVDRSFQRTGEGSARALLLAWKLRGIGGDEVLAEGLFPEPGSANFPEHAV